MKLPGSSRISPCQFLILIRRSEGAHRIRQRQHMGERRKSIIISAVGIIVKSEILQDLSCLRYFFQHILICFVSVTVQDQHDDIFARGYGKLLLSGQRIHFLFFYTVWIGEKQTDHRHRLDQHKKRTQNDRCCFTAFLKPLPRKPSGYMAYPSHP